MALSLRTRGALAQNSNLRERIRMAIIDVANTVASEAPPAADAAADVKATYVKRQKLANALMQYSPNWIDLVLPRIIGKAAFESVAANLTADSAYLTQAQETAMDTALVTLITNIFDKLTDIPN